MEFWGVEVKAGEPLKVEPGEDMILHLSQASLGEAKKDKGNESVVLYVKIDGQKLVIGTLSADKCAHISYDLVFEKEFELSHNWKNGSVYFCGYRSFVSDEPSGFSDSESDDEDLPLKLIENGKPEPKVEESKPAAEKAKAVAKPAAEKAKAVAKPDSSANKQKVKVVEPSKDHEDEDNDSVDDEDEDDSEEDESDDEDMLEAEGDSDDEDEDDESSDEEDEATPKKADVGKKRPAAADSATKTPVEKKAKLVTPQKTGGDGKKGGGHTATPHPSKQAGKTPANSDKKQQTPKSGGQFSCKACNKSFSSDNGLQSHTKAKHSAGK